MRIPQSYIQKCKIVAHVFQAVLVFVATCLAIAVMVKDGEVGGATKYFFAICFLSFPAIIYLTMVPAWSRAQRFANAYAFLAVDAIYTILWFCAFIAVALWNSYGINKGGEDKKIAEGDRNCTTFAYGNEKKCKVSTASVGLGAVICLLFVITTAVSGYYLRQFLREGSMPYQAAETDAHHISGDSAKDNAWSTEIEPHRNEHDDDDDEEDRRTEHGGNQHEDEYALLHSTETEDGRHPGRPMSWGDDRAGFGRTVPPYADYRESGSGLGADALSPGGYEEYRSQAGLGGVERQASHAGTGYSFSSGR
ncbi:hypothetical protein P153DRAFT_293347 [Dothidotthia symphoricarpi CBS 119687]|uniref:MARVEL domain-containing protein n=1 Tax=Dothidotthia symphoricarpi CBS 119687 TaxID=1392245 RepID=A0A6A6ACP3_9PLEO|nr:uncharacterized protein P153DRAFT_293347 [Dothidotthia symphoricarpi CBS 119687]KAF2128501.1 hypothetical protein P153DRAFT_293347 [Dothidotthia symphoricarpi CBS 119687]